MCKHYLVRLTSENRHFINSAKDNNCVLCLADRLGPLTQAEVAAYLGVSKMRICQIEKKALKKVRKKINMLYR